MNIKEILEYLAIELIYTVVCGIYMLLLNALNKELIYLGLDKNPFELLAYRDYLPLCYFVIAVLLITIGCWRIYERIRGIAKSSLILEEILFSIVAIIVVTGWMIGVIVLINNPIFTAIFTIVLITHVYAGVNT